MIWLTWRQARTQFLVIFGVAAAMAVVMAATGPHIASAASSDPTQFLRRYTPDSVERQLYLLGLVMYAVPAVIGVFWGAPLIAREVEAGTHRLVWGQSITRRRWLALKLALTGLAAVAASGLISLAVTWWAGPIDKAIGHGHGSGLFNAPRLDPVVFAARGVVPVAYTVFALAVGVVVGLLIRRTVPAMAITLAGVVIVQVLVPSMVREHLAQPEAITTAITQDNLQGMLISGPPPEEGGKPGQVKAVDSIRVDATEAGDWELANQTISPSGRIAGSLPAWIADCGGPPGDDTLSAKRTACFDRLASEGYQQKVTYQPASAFWSLQWREAGLLVVGALLLSGFAFWRIRRDL
jgi:hypothetical protein